MQSIKFLFNEQENFTGLLDEQNNPWFVAKEVCDILGLTNVTVSMNRLDEDEKLMYPLVISGQSRDTWCINESGLYNLIFGSNKEEARAFRKWVTATVLPTIRKEGVFGENHILDKERAVQEKLDDIDKQKETIKETKQKYDDARSKLNKLNNDLHQILKTAPNQLRFDF